MTMERRIIEVRDLTVTLQGRRVLEKVGFSLLCGDAALLTGSNGCGKTTLLRSLVGLQPVVSGRISLFGEDIRSRVWKKQRHLLAYMPQEELIHPFPVSVWEMASMGTAGLQLNRSDRKQRISQALKDTGCWDLRNRSYFTLSGGEKKRTALARCLCQKAHLLLLDEPLTYLDKDARKRFIAVLDCIRRQYSITVLMVTHTEEDLEEIAWRRLQFQDGVLRDAQEVPG
jgi:ABC-type Mn2+/Zn2+ transport system ATPase subunit